MADLNALFAPQPLSYYEEMVKSKNELSITLNKQEAAVALKLHDRGFGELNAEEMQLVYHIIFKIKDELWP